MRWRGYMLILLALLHFHTLSGLASVQDGPPGPTKGGAEAAVGGGGSSSGSRRMRLGVVLPPKKDKVIEPLRCALAKRGFEVDFERVDLKSDASAVGWGAGEGRGGEGGGDEVLLTHCGYLYGAEDGSWWEPCELENLESIEGSGIAVVDRLVCQRIMCDREAVLERMGKQLEADREHDGQGREAAKGIPCGKSRMICLLIML